MSSRPHVPGFGYARALAMPVLALGYVLVRPEPVWAVAAWVAAFFLIDLYAEASPREQRPPVPSGRVSFDLLLYTLSALHFGNLALAVDLVGDIGLASHRSLAALLLLGLSSSVTGIVLAHELIHRRRPAQRLLGRALLATVLHEHFYTEHIRGHHPRVGRPADPATARPGEPLTRYIARNLPGQWRSAWRLEADRLRGRPWSLHNRVVQGVFAEAGLLLVASAWGPEALVFLLAHAAVPVLFLQVVNYIEHWGIVRGSGPVRAEHSWDSDNRSNLYSLLGLPRHADHHLHPGRPYHQLRHRPDSRQLPHGYGRMLWLAIFHNRRFRALMTRELQHHERAVEPAFGD